MIQFNDSYIISVVDIRIYINNQITFKTTVQHALPSNLNNDYS